MTYNGAQLHLLVNHVPVIAYPIATLALLHAIFWKDEGVYLFACYLTIATGILTVAAYLTGEGAEGVLKKLPDYPRDLVHLHEDTAMWGMIFGIAAGVAAILILPAIQKIFKFLKNAFLQRQLRRLILILCMVISGLFAVAAHQGGIIRHTEIRD